MIATLVQRQGEIRPDMARYIKIEFVEARSVGLNRRASLDRVEEWYELTESCVS